MFFILSSSWDLFCVVVTLPHCLIVSASVCVMFYVVRKDDFLRSFSIHIIQLLTLLNDAHPIGSHNSIDGVYADIICRYYMQILYADIICRYYMQILYADIICRYYMQTLYCTILGTILEIKTTS